MNFAQPMPVTNGNAKNKMNGEFLNNKRQALTCLEAKNTSEEYAYWILSPGRMPYKDKLKNS